MHGKGYILINIEPCARCDSPSQSANSVLVLEPEAKLKRLGLKPAEPLPELQYCEELQDVVCEDCINEIEGR